MAANKKITKKSKKKVEIVVVEKPVFWIRAAANDVWAAYKNLFLS